MRSYRTRLYALQVRVPLQSLRRSLENVPFSHLPKEILVQIISFLPTPSVQAVRLASRTMASVHLPVSYWHSRFQFPNELCHIKLPSHLSPGRFDRKAIDWKSFCNRLLYPEQNEPMKNRSRISDLIKKFLLEMTTDQRSAGQTDRDSPAARQNIVYHRKLAAQGIKVSSR